MASRFTNDGDLDASGNQARMVKVQATGTKTYRITEILPKTTPYGLNQHLILFSSRVYAMTTASRVIGVPISGGTPSVI